MYHLPCPILSVILSERSEVGVPNDRSSSFGWESKDLRLVLLAKGWETTNPKIRNQAVRDLSYIAT
jgi:hypothetical protein